MCPLFFVSTSPLPHSSPFITRSMHLAPCTLHYGLLEHTCIFNCRFMNIQLHIHVCSNNPLCHVERGSRPETENPRASTGVVARGLCLFNNTSGSRHWCSSRDNHRCLPNPCLFQHAHRHVAPTITAAWDGVPAMIHAFSLTNPSLLTLGSKTPKAYIIMEACARIPTTALAM